MYIFLPVGQAPRLIDAEPTDSRISDDLGGTFVRSSTGTNIAAHLLDDVHLLPFNPAAAYLLSITIGRTFPARGPVVVTGLNSLFNMHLDGMDVAVGGHAVSLDKERARIGAEFGEEGFLAYYGSVLDAGHVYTAKVREWLDLAEAIEIPEGWPGVINRALRETLTNQPEVPDGGPPTSPDGPFIL
jgi:hypothetical protein